MRWMTPPPTTTRLATPSLPNPCPAAPSAARLSAHPKRSADSRGRIVSTTGSKRAPVLASAGESGSSSSKGSDAGRATAATDVSTSSAADVSTSSSAADPSSSSSADADRRARLSRVLAYTASSTSSASEAYSLLSSSGLSPPEVAAAASAMLVEAALAAGNAALALDVFRAMVAPPLPVGGLLNNTSSNRREGGNGADPKKSGGTALASWPRPTPAVAASLAVAMARSLRPADAEAVLQAVRGRGPLLAGREGKVGIAVGEVPFGFVVPSPALSLALGAAAAGAAGALATPPSPLSDEAEQRSPFGASASSSSSSSSASASAASASAPQRPPLAVVQPHEGVRTVACPSCRYRLELFSGTVARASSAPAAPSRGGVLATAASFLLKRPAPAAAVHELDVVTPSGVSRPFRFGTATGDAPAAVGERVTVVCSPSSTPGDNGSPSSSAVADFGWARRGLLSPSPPGTRPGEPLLVANHATALAVDALDPPAADSNASSSSSTSSSLIPPWAGPLVLLAVAGDAASALADPALPLALAAAAAGAAASAAAARSVVLPALRRLPEAAVGVEASRSGLLAQHVALTRASDACARGAAEDARALARLWALRAKMDSVSAAARASSSSSSSSSSAFLDGGGDDGASRDGSFVGDGGEYAERGGRVEAAAAALERRLARAVELLDGYARVAARIEIEVELESEVPAAEAAAISSELQRLRSLLGEVESAAAAGAAAADEVERLLRSP